jgi:hypothetical protein
MAVTEAVSDDVERPGAEVGSKGFGIDKPSLGATHEPACGPRLPKRLPVSTLAPLQKPKLHDALIVVAKTRLVAGSFLGMTAVPPPMES